MELSNYELVRYPSGQFVLLRTGFDEVIFECKKQPTHEKMHKLCVALDGADQKLQQWVTDSKVAALISDNYAVEIHNGPLRPGQCAMLPLHQHCLFKTGVNLGEIWRLSELADWLRSNNRSRFLLTAPPLRLPGAVGSPATPVATV